MHLSEGLLVIRVGLKRGLVRLLYRERHLWSVVGKSLVIKDVLQLDKTRRSVEMDVGGSQFVGRVDVKRGRRNWSHADSS